MENEKIYVLVPVYNVEAYLERCIDSILNQTYQNWELVLVNDGSKDNSGAICDRYAAEHDNITVIHQENGGVSVARNIAVSYALEHGDHNRDWISFVDSDDFVHPKYLEYLHRAAKEAGTDISCCGYIETKDLIPEFSVFPLFNYTCLIVEEHWCKQHNKAIVIWNKLYKVYLFETVYFPRNKIAEDQIVAYKTLFQCSTIAYIPEKLYFYYASNNSIMRSPWSPQMLDELDAKEEHAAFFVENGFQLAYQLAVREFFLCSMKHLRYIESRSPKYNYLKSSIRKRVRTAFLLYAHEVGYTKALIFGFDHRIKNPIQRILKNESIISFIKRKMRQSLHVH